MIRRIWRGWTADATAAADYQRLLTEEIAPGIMARQIPGVRQLDVLRELTPGTAPLTAAGQPGVETEFVTVMSFEDWAAVEAFAGGDGRSSVVPPAARELLHRWDHHSAHYRLITSL